MKLEKSGSFVVNVPRIDYLTLTTYEQTAWQFWKSALDGNQELEQDDDETQIMQYMGYFWRNGTGNAYLGSGMQKRGMHIMLRISGDLAHQMFGRVAKNPLKEMWGKVTRLDLQITVPMPDKWSQKRLHFRLTRAGKEPDTKSSQSGLNRRVLRTVYLGSRHSNRFHRVYEKQVDGGDIYLRYECEYSRQLATKMAREILQSPSIVSQYLLGELQAIGDDDLESVFAHNLIGQPSRETVKRVQSHDKTRRWLLENVLPAFTRHINDHSADGEVALAFGRAIGDALGGVRIRPE